MQERKTASRQKVAQNRASGLFTHLERGAFVVHFETTLEARGKWYFGDELRELQEAVRQA